MSGVVDVEPAPTIVSVSLGPIAMFAVTDFGAASEGDDERLTAILAPADAGQRAFVRTALTRALAALDGPEEGR